MYTILVWCSYIQISFLAYQAFTNLIVYICMENIRILKKCQVYANRGKKSPIQYVKMLSPNSQISVTILLTSLLGTAVFLWPSDREADQKK